MKIAVIAPTFLPARRANTIQVMKMSHAFARQGHEVRLAVPTTPDQYLSSNGLRRWDYLYHFYGLTPGEGKDAEGLFEIEWLLIRPDLHSYDFGWLSLNWARRWGAELIYTRHPQAALFASLAGKATILEVHDMPQGRCGPWLFRGFLAGRGALRLVVITRALANDLAVKYGVPHPGEMSNRYDVVVAADAVDLERYRCLPTPTEARQALLALASLGKGNALGTSALASNNFIAGYSGHLYPGRGAEMLLVLAERLPEITFLLIGGEPQSVEQLRQQARYLSNVILTGFVPNADLPLYQAACDVLLMPYQRRVAASSGGDISRYLSPMKLFEYMACGRAIVATDLPVFREVLNPSNAVLLPADDLEAWAKALKTLWTDSERRQTLGDQARYDVAQYTWEARAAKVLSVAEIIR